MIYWKLSGRNYVLNGQNIPGAMDKYLLNLVRIIKKPKINNHTRFYFIFLPSRFESV